VVRHLELGNLLVLILSQSLSKRMGCTPNGVGSKMDQAQALQDTGSLNKGILCGTKKGEEFVKRGTATTRTPAKLPVRGSEALVAGRTEVVGACNGERTKKGAATRRTEPFEGGVGTTRTSKGWCRSLGNEAGSKGGKEMSTKVMKKVEHMLLKERQVG
jgi:hypothetical protein